MKIIKRSHGNHGNHRNNSLNTNHTNGTNILFQMTNLEWFALFENKGFILLDELLRASS